MKHAAARLAHVRTALHALAALGLAVVALTATSAGAARPTITLTTTSPGNGSTVSGNVVWQISASGGSPSRVDFAVDGSLLWSQTSAPYGGTLDTTKLSNGQHTLTATAQAGPGNGNGNASSTSVTVTVSNAAPATAPAVTSAPAISGSPVVGQALAASTGGWSGTTPMTYGYQWQRCNGSGASCAAISGAAASSYTVQTADAGSTLRVSVVATNGAGSSTATSAATAAVATSVISAPAVTVAPAISGTATVGQALTTTSGSWSGTTPMTYAYSWKRCDSQGATCAAISGATASSYTPTSADQGSTLRAVVTASNSAGFASATSAATASVQSGSFTTSLVQGGTLTTPYTWTFNPGTATSAGYFWIDGVLAAKVTGSGPYSYSLPTGQLTNGTHTFGHAWDTTAGVHQTPASTYSETVQNPAAPSGTGTPTWPSTAEPAYTPNRVATTPSEFLSILSSLKPGDVVEVKPMTITGEVSVAARPASPGADIHFDAGVKFTGPAAGTMLPAVWLHGANLRLYGGEVSNLAHDCVRVQAGSADPGGPTNIRWWGVKIHDCAATGLSVQGTSYPNTGLDIAAEIWQCGLNLTLDPHQEKGTGLHGAYLGGATTVTSGRFLLNVHDQPTGAAVSVGANLQNSELWVNANRITFSATYQVAGNAIQFWGGNNKNVTVHDIEADTLAGRMVETDALSSGTGLVVEYARGHNVALTPAYALGSYVACKDCALR